MIVNHAALIIVVADNLLSLEKKVSWEIKETKSAKVLIDPGRGTSFILEYKIY